MKAMKFAAISCTALATSAAFGSFDMLLQSDFDNNLGNHIDRYDPLNGVYLGSFRVFGAPTSMAASSARGLVYVKYGSSNVDIFNYSTGEYVRTVFLTGSNLALNSSQDKLYSAYNSAANVLDLNTQTVSSITLAGQSTSNCLYVGDGGRLFVADDISMTYRSYSASGAFISSAGYGGATNVKQIGKRVNTFTSTTNSYRVATNQTSTMVGFNETISSGVITHGYDSMPDLYTVTGVVDAHEGYYYVGTKLSAPTILKSTRINSGGLIASSYNLTQTSLLNGQSAIVLAPEPAPILALSTAFLGLLKRKKKR